VPLVKDDRIAFLRFAQLTNFDSCSSQMSTLIDLLTITLNDHYNWPNVKPLFKNSASTTFLLYAEPLSISAGRNPGVPLKKRAEERNILVAYGVTDFLHGAMVAL
jgi:hypothetical protein